MSNGYAADEPRHVEMAQIDEDVRSMAIAHSIRDLEVYCPRVFIDRFDTEWCRPVKLLPSTHVVARALRVLRHFGLLVEHGDGVVSVKEQ